MICDIISLRGISKCEWPSKPRHIADSFFFVCYLYWYYHIYRRNILKKYQSIEKEKRASVWLALFLFCCVGFSSPDKPKPICWKVTAVLSMHMHDADSISRLCSHTPCHVWSNFLHAPDLPDLSACHDPQWSAVIWSLIPLLTVIDHHWSSVI